MSASLYWGSLVSKKQASSSSQWKPPLCVPILIAVFNLFVTFSIQPVITTCCGHNNHFINHSRLSLNCTQCSNKLYETINVTRSNQKSSKLFCTNFTSSKTLDWLLYKDLSYKKLAWIKPWGEKEIFISDLNIATTLFWCIHQVHVAAANYDS